MGSFVFLCHASDVTLSEEQLVGPFLVAQGLSSYAQALVGIVSRAEAKDRAQSCHRSRAQGSGKL
jgi:hypothetical protein